MAVNAVAILLTPYPFASTVIYLNLFNLHFHLVSVTKYRKDVFNQIILDEMKKYPH